MREIITTLDLDKPMRGRPPLDAPSRESGAPTSPGPPIAGDPVPDDYRSRLVKYIPSEVVAVYLALAGILATLDDGTKKMVLSWSVFVVLLSLTPAYLAMIERVQKKQQLAISTASFFVWVFTFGGPFEGLSWYDPVYGALVLPLFTFAVPIWEARA